MAVDGMVAQGIKASPTMILTEFSSYMQAGLTDDKLTFFLIQAVSQQTLISTNVGSDTCPHMASQGNN